MKKFKWQFLPNIRQVWRHLFLILMVLCLLVLGTNTAYAGLNDDRYDGNIFVVYAGNGSLIPARSTLKQAMAVHKPAVLAFYVDDSSDCKEYALVISRIQEFYGREAEIIPVSVDTVSPQETYTTSDAGYYYSGGVPQIVVFNQSGEVVLNKQGQVPFEEIDDKLRQVFDLLPRSASVPLKRRSFNELNSELTE